MLSRPSVPICKIRLDYATEDLDDGAADLRAHTHICKARSQRSDPSSSLAFHVVRSSNTIVRWTEGSKLTYFVSEKGLSPDEVQFVRAAMMIASSNWQQAELVVSFQETLCRDDAVFVVEYDHKLGEEVFARAFFPGGTRRRIDLGLRFFDTTKHRSNILTHELGHVLGLRHEHWEADECSELDVAHRYPPDAQDEFSVMNHKHAGKLALLVVSQDDRKFIREFYSLPVGQQGGVNIEEVVATPYRAN